MINFNQICMGCMESKGSAAVCPACGWAEGTAPESVLHLPPRTLLYQKYLIGRVLGQGGFGITYLAWDINLDRKLAVKEYFPRELVSRKPGDGTVLIHSGALGEQYNFGLSKFLEEAKTLAKFDGHPNIISVKDFFRTNDTAYLVMNYLEGATLKDYLSRRGSSLSFQEALAVMLPVMDALQVVHVEGLLHRDISPDNIFITAQGLVILLDFGAARHALGESGRNLSVILKPGYAPEEQYRSAGVQGPWTDIYAVGATFYHILTGRMPPESLDRLERDLLAPPSHLGVAIGAAQEAALLKALSVRASERFQAVSALQDALWFGSGSSSVPVTMAAGSAGYTLPDACKQRAAPEASSLQFSDSNAINIGRHPSNDLVLGDQSVSRYHACIYMQSGRWHIADRGSTYGTFVDGVRINSPVELTPSAHIGISSLVFTFDGVNLRDDRGEVAKTLPPTFPYAQPVSKALTAQNRSSRARAVHSKLLLYTTGAVCAIILIAAGIMLFLGLGQKDARTALGLADGEELSYGTIEYEGGVYTGELKNGVPHGYGTYIYKSGSSSLGYSQLVTSGEKKYVGQWVEGKKHGGGTMTMPDGSTIIGLWEHDTYMGPQKD